MRARTPWLSLLLGALIGGAAVASDFDVVISEIHYHPASTDSEERGEFVELWNTGPREVDLSGWRFTDGIEFEFDEGTLLPAGGRIVVTRAPEAAGGGREADLTAGPYIGVLDNGGETIELVDARGRLVNRVHYRDDPPWPTLADGLGPSLEFTGSDNGNDVSHFWEASTTLGGTPGRPNSRHRETAEWVPRDERALLGEGGPWRTWKGRSAPSAVPGEWTTPDFDDSSWTSLPGAFGFGGGHGLPVASTLDDMSLSYTTFFIRGAFEVQAEDVAMLSSGTAVLQLRVTYNDAFVAYINGVEVGRDNVGSPGDPVPHDASAWSERTEIVVLSLEDIWQTLELGTNLVAVVGISNGTDSPDFYLGAEVSLEEAAEPSDPAGEDAMRPGLINEIKPSEGALGTGFVELYNPGSEDLVLGSHLLVSTAGLVHELPQVVDLPPLGRVLIPDTDMSAWVPNGPAVLLVLRPDGRTIVDSLEVRAAPEGSSFGRFPDGSDDAFVLLGPTPSDSNVHALACPIVINEIFYHPLPDPSPGGCTARASDARQWIELYNRSAEEVDLTGWSVTKGLDYALEPGTRIGGHGFLVIAASLESFQADHPDVENVVGDWSGRLSHASDTLNLRDRDGNRVDHVRYGDGGPLNDEDPADGFDDGTFRGSDWPLGADGTGHSIELADPDRENKFGGAWRASTTRGGTPGAPNSSLGPPLPPLVASVLHAPAVPSPEDTVRVTCRISSAGDLQTAEVIWSPDAVATSPRVAELRDDGLSGDEAAGDGLFSAVIPPQPENTVVRFRVVARDGDDREAVFPPQAPERPYATSEGSFCLYEVDSSPLPPNGAPVYRVLMAKADQEELTGRLVTSNVLLPGTFVAGSEVHYTVGIRYRGESSRREPNKSFRIMFPPERTFRGIRRLNLNGSNGGVFNSLNFNEILSMDLFRRAGLPYAQEWPVTIHFPGAVYRDFDARYVRKEAFDGEFLSRTFGASDGGDFYRARNPLGSGAASGDLAFRGDDPDAYRELYERQGACDADDLAGIIELTRALDPNETPDEEFPGEMERLIDPVEWARFFAVFTCLGNTDGGIWNDNGEDYFLYRVPETSQRADAGRWLLIGWDVEETFIDASERLFRPTLPAVRRFLTHPPFARLYYQQVDDLAGGVFSRREMSHRFGAARVMYPPGDAREVIDEVDGFLARRLGYFQENISHGLQAGAVHGSGDAEWIVEVGDEWKFFRGRRDPTGSPLDWTEVFYDDTSWESGPTGIGFDDGDDVTVLDDMFGSYTTVYARHRFELSDPDTITALTLIMDYDDAYVAYINGLEVARSGNAPAGEVIPFDETAMSPHDAVASGGELEIVDVSHAAWLLEPGPNVFAVLGLNQNLASGDFSLAPALSASRQPGGEGLGAGCGRILYAQGERVHLSGMADASSTASVTVNGQLATVEYVTGGIGPFGAAWTAELDVDLSGGSTQVVVAAYEGAEAPGVPIELLDTSVRAAPAGFRLVEGELPPSTRWAASDGPIRLLGPVRVPAGGILRIAEGAVVICDPDAWITVEGQLRAEGSNARPVTFVSLVCDRSWQGISFENTGTGAGDPVHTLRSCRFESGRAAWDREGFLSATSSRLTVEDCRFSEIDANAIDVVGSHVEVSRCEFETVYEGIHGVESTVEVEQCTFRNLVGDRDAIDLDGDGSERSRVERCLFENGVDDGVDAGWSSVSIRNSEFVGFGDKAISLEGPGALGHPALSNNVIRDCAIGIALKDGVDVVEGHHSTIVGCESGISLFVKVPGSDGARGTFHSMILWDNVESVTVDDLSKITLSFSDVGSVGGDYSIWPGQRNISEDPQFVDPSSGDYALRPTSPCRGGGLGGTDMGALPAVGEPPVLFLRGDANESGDTDLSDAVATLGFLYVGSAPPSCHDRMDADDTGVVELTDAVYILLYLYVGGAPLPPPSVEPGFDPTPDALPCDGP